MSEKYCLTEIMDYNVELCRGDAHTIAKYLDISENQVRYSAKNACLTKGHYRIEYQDMSKNVAVPKRKSIWLIVCDTKDNDNIVHQGNYKDIADALGVSVANVRQACYSGYLIFKQYGVYKDE